MTNPRKGRKVEKAALERMMDRFQMVVDINGKALVVSKSDAELVVELCRAALALPADSSEARDAERLKWLCDEAYVITGKHTPGECGYDKQKEAVALWVKQPCRSDNASIIAAIDAAIAAQKDKP